MAATTTASRPSCPSCWLSSTTGSTSSHFRGLARGEHRSPHFAAWGELLWRRPVALGGAALVVLLLLAAPILGLRTSMPSIKVLPATAAALIGYDRVPAAFGPGAPGTLQIVAAARDAAATENVLRHDPGIAAALPPQTARDGSGLALIQAVPTADPSAPALGSTVSRLRADLPSSARIGGAAVENLDAMVGAVAHSGRVIFAAGAVMVAVFFTFSLSGPLPPKEMGIILGVAVLLDAFLVRLVLLRLTGRAAWACPRWLRRALPSIRFSH